MDAESLILGAMHSAMIPYVGELGLASSFRHILVCLQMFETTAWVESDRGLTLI